MVCVQVPGARFLQGDFTANETKAQMRRLLGGAPVVLHVDNAVLVVPELTTLAC